MELFQKIINIIVFLAVISFQVTTSFSLIEQPRDMEVTEGSNVVLKCTFDEIVQNCWWKRNTFAFEINGRYKYINRPNTLSSGEDCSIEILNTTIKDDAAEWQCESNPQHSRQKVTSRKAKLTVKPVPTSPFEVEPESQALTPNGSIVLHCKLRHPFKTCYWIRNHFRVTIDDRYQFTNGTGINTDDCSLKIKDGKLIDSGTWQCAANGDHTNRGYLSKVAIVAVVQSETSFAVTPTCPECPTCPTIPLFPYPTNPPHPPPFSKEVNKSQMEEYHFLNAKSTVMLWVVIVLLAVVASISTTLNIKTHRARQRHSSRIQLEEHPLSPKESDST